MGKGSAIANIVSCVAPLFAGLFVIFFSQLDSFRPGAGVALAVVVMLLGFVAFALAKFTQFRSGHWFILGPRGMSSWARRSYAIGLIAVGIGAIGSVGAVFLTRPW